MIELLKKLKHSIEWPRKRQFELLRSIIGQDAQWMAHDKTVRALTKRYLGIMRDDWEHEPIERVDELRDQLGLNPWKTQPQAPVVDHFDDVNNMIPRSRCHDAFLKLYDDDDDDLKIFEDGWEASRALFAQAPVFEVPTEDELHKAYSDWHENMANRYVENGVEIDYAKCEEWGIAGIHTLLQSKGGAVMLPGQEKAMKEL